MDFPKRLLGLKPGQRIVIALQQRWIDFSNVEVPEIELGASVTIKECKKVLELLYFLEAFPEARRSNFSWWALDRMEDCASCGRRFHTRRMHWALAITITETITVSTPEAGNCDRLIACWYPERFCLSCPPPRYDAFLTH